MHMRTRTHEAVDLPPPGSRGDCIQPVFQAINGNYQRFNRQGRLSGNPRKVRG